MSHGPPPTRVDFASAWDRYSYLLDSLKYWFWEEEHEANAKAFADQLAELLEELDPRGTTLHGAEGWALVMAARRDWRSCLVSKRHEVDILRHLLTDGIDPEIVDAQDVVIAAEQYVLLARAGGDAESGDWLVTELLRDGSLDQKQRAFVGELRSGSPRWESDGGVSSERRNRRRPPKPH